jgi:glyoxylase-like metal-dependent hydrolase (beta-lactamase superfamily II)
MINQISVGELQTNCWIVSTPDGVLLVDPGAEGGRIIARLKQLTLRPAWIVLTHAHFDHVGALSDLAAAYPDAEILIHRDESAKLGPASLENHRRDFRDVGGEAYIDALWKPLPEAKRFIDEESTVGPFTVIHLPGHSPGSIGLLWEGEKTLISGDTLFCAGVGRTDLAGGDQGQLEQSLARLFTLDGEIKVYPGHGSTTTIQRERARFSQ